MFLYRQGVQPKVFNDVWPLNNNNLRNSDDFKVKHLPTNATYLINYPYYYYPTAWNRLPSHIKLIQNKKTFLATLHKHLLDTVNH